MTASDANAAGRAWWREMTRQSLRRAYLKRFPHMTTDPEIGYKQAQERTRPRFQIGSYVRELNTGQLFSVVGFEDYGGRLIVQTVVTKTLSTADVEPHTPTGNDGEST